MDGRTPDRDVPVAGEVRGLGDDYEVVGIVNESCGFDSDSEFEIFIAVPHETFPLHY